MTNEELVELYQNGDESALEQLIEQNKKAVHYIARQYYTSKTASIDYDDLFQEGNIGLMIAANKYEANTERAVPFNSYAAYWIKAKISRFIEQKNTNDEISLNAPVGGEDGGERGDFIPDEKDYFCEVEESAWHRDLARELRKVMAEVLSLTQREVLEMRYGFDFEGAIPIDYKPKKYGDWSVRTFKEVAEEFGLSPERIRQIESSALRNIRWSDWGKNKFRNDVVELDQRKSRKHTDHISILQASTNDFFSDILQSIEELEAK